MNLRLLVEFVDGSKTMVEMAAIANATGLTPDKPGMHGPASSREDLNKVLVLPAPEVCCRQTTDGLISPSAKASPPACLSWPKWIIHVSANGWRN